MSDEEYELQVLLKLRKQERDEAEARYASALEAHQKIERKVQELELAHHRLARQRVEKCRAFDKRVASQPISMAEIHGFDRHVVGLRDAEEKAWQKVEQAKREQQRLRRQMETAHQQMLQALRQLKAVEKHYEKWQREQAVVQKRRQSAKMDDVAARLWRGQQG